jgi:hypothetical protein
LLNVIERAEVDDTPLLRFVRAALGVIHGTNISGTRRRDSAPMDPVTAAKYLTGTLKPVGMISDTPVRESGDSPAWDFE